ncbi:MAG: 3-hydroxyacyl-CoA dehydrogenase NAD-binding domain-containing protein [Isosphaeraceae bacterium]
MVEPTESRGSVIRAAVIGAGQMGSGIAGVLLRAGIPTTLIDVNPAMLATAAARVDRIARHARGGGGAEGGVAGATAPGLVLSSRLEELREEDVVIEAVSEDEDVKTGLFRALSDRLPGSTILASNTSTIPITRLARAVVHPGRFAGLHFFHPVHRMDLVEVIRGERSSPETASFLVDLGRRLGKTPIVVRDGPGFFTTRVLSAYIDQALRLVESGVPTERVDAVATAFGMPSGPIALLDLIGLDTALAISRVMAAAFPDRFRVSPLLERLVGEGRLGRKTGVGFRSYGQERRTSGREAPLPVPGRSTSGETPAVTEREIIDRLLLAMLLETIRALEEGIVSCPHDADLGVVLGLGFPASRGGILAWCDAEGPAAIIDRLAPYRDLGPAFRPPGLLVRTAGRAIFHHDP